MNILIIGHESDKMYHFGENIVEPLRNEGNTVKFLSCEKIQSMLTPKEWKLHMYKKKPLSILSVIWTDDYDLIVIDQNDLFIKNETEIPLFYNQKYIHRSSSVDKADVLFFLTEPLLNYFKTIRDPYLCHQAKRLEVMPCAVNPEIYQPQEKVYKGISWFGSKNETEHQVDTNELISIAQRTLYRKEEKILREMGGLRMFETPCPSLKYRELLAKSSAFFMSIPRGQFISRMILEAMACKTLCIFTLQSKRHEQVLRDMGFENRIHYVGVDNMEDIKEAHDNCDREFIIHMAYQQVLERHTYEARAKQIMEVFKSLKF